MLHKLLVVSPGLNINFLEMGGISVPQSARGSSGFEYCNSRGRRSQCCVNCVQLETERSSLEKSN